MSVEFDIYFKEETFTDLNPLFIGRQICESNHSFGPRICPYTIIHYVLSGKGTVEQNGTVYEVSNGQIFIIFADEIAKYSADTNEPWDYIWIAYDGLYLKKLAILETPVLNVSVPIFEDLLKNCIDGICDKYYAVSALYKLHSLFLLNSEHEAAQNYPAQVKKIIQLKYMQSISVEEIAHSLNIDKRYMSRIFKKKYGKTVIEYIIDIRMNKACELLRRGYSVADTSALVGYSDSFNFSKMFAKKIGLSPREYKRNIE